jgi:hypothetical protein
MFALINIKKNMSEENKLKMKFKLHQLEFEIEGNQDVVKEQFENFKSFITGDLLPKINIEEPRQQAIAQQVENMVSKQIPQAEEIELVEIAETEIPSLKDIKLRDLAKTEADWMIVYCYFASKGGNKTFTRSDIVQLYKDSGRYTDKITNGLAQYFKNSSKKGLIKATSDTDFIILEKGKVAANQIFKGNSKSKSFKPKNATKNDSSDNKKSSATNSKKFEYCLDKKLNLRPDGKESLKDFSDKYELDSTPKQILVIVYYLKEILGIETISGNHIYTGLDELGGRVPQSLKQIIINTKGRNYGWLDYESMDDISLSIQGRNAIKHDLIIKQ